MRDYFCNFGTLFKIGIHVLDISAKAELLALEIFDWNCATMSSRQSPVGSDERRSATVKVCDPPPWIFSCILATDDSTLLLIDFNVATERRLVEGLVVAPVARFEPSSVSDRILSIRRQA